MKMSIRDYDEAKELIKNSSKINTFLGPKDEKLIKAAEENRTVKFPQTYHNFL